MKQHQRDAISMAWADLLDTVSDELHIVAEHIRTRVQARADLERIRAQRPTREPWSCEHAKFELNGRRLVCTDCGKTMLDTSSCKHRTVHTAGPDRERVICNSCGQDVTNVVPL